MKYDLYVGIWKLYDPYYRNTKSFDTLDAAAGAQQTAQIISRNSHMLPPLLPKDLLSSIS